MSNQAGPYFSLRDLGDLQSILGSGRASNLVEELHRLANQKPLDSPGAHLADSAAMVFSSPKSVIQGLKAAVEAGIADNYTYHFALTALALFQERGEFILQPLRPDPEALKGFLRSLDRPEAPPGSVVDGAPGLSGGSPD